MRILQLNMNHWRQVQVELMTPMTCTLCYCVYMREPCDKLETSIWWLLPHE